MWTVNTEVIKEIANQLGIAASAVTKDVIPAYASYVVASHISRAAILVVITISLLVLARFVMSKSKKHADWEKEKTSYKRSEAKEYHETFEMVGYIFYTLGIIFAFFAVADILTLIPWIVSPYGAFVSLLVS